MATRELRASSSETVPVEFLYSQVIPLRHRVLLLLASRGGMSRDKGCWMSRKLMAQILLTTESRVERELRELVHPRPGGRGTPASPKVERVEWEDDGKKREGFRLIVSPEEAVTDDQLRAMSSKVVRYCRACELEDTRTQVQGEMDDKKGWPCLFLMTDFDIANVGTGKELIAWQRKLKAWASWEILNEAWAAVPWLRKYLDVQREARFWKSVVANTNLNPCPWAKRIKDEKVRAQVGLLMVSSHLMAKVKDGRCPSPRDPAAFLCGVLQTIDPTKDACLVPSPEAVAADMKFFDEGQEVWDVRSLAEGDDPPEHGDLIDLASHRKG